MDVKPQRKKSARAHGLAALALLALCTWMTALGATEQPLTMSVSGEIVIQRDGSVRESTIDNKTLAPAVRTLVQKAVAGWKFQPVMQDGQPIVARTGYALRLLAEPTAGGYRLKVDDVQFVTPRKVLVRVSPTSGEVLSLRQDVHVMAAVRVDGAGKVVDAEVMAVQSMRDAGGVRNRRAYEKTVEQALRRWTFEPARRDLGDSDELTGVVTFLFQSGGGDPLSDWKQPQWHDVKQVPWLRDTDLSSLQGGTLMAKAEGIRLQSPVTGTML